MTSPVVNYGTPKTGQPNQLSPATSNINKTTAPPSTTKPRSTPTNQPAIQKPAQKEDQFYAPDNNTRSQNTKQKSTPPKQAKNTDQGWKEVTPDFSNKKSAQRQTPQSSRQSSYQNTGNHSAQTNTRPSNNNSYQQNNNIKQHYNSPHVTPAPQPKYIPAQPQPKKR